MNGSVMQLAAIITLLGIDSVLDIKTREIPNLISGAIALTAFLNFDVRSLWGLIVAVIFFAVALFTGKIGGGDVKLIAALSVVCGLWGSFALLLFAQIAMLIFYTISQDFTDDQREAIENMREWLAEMDTVIAENENGYSLDGDMVRAVFYCLQFGVGIVADFDYDGFCECFDGLTMERLDEALQNISEKFPQYSITENQKTAIQNVYLYLTK